MHIHCIGVNHRAASVEQREKLAFDDEQMRAALARLGHRTKGLTAREMVILSTCNRVEIYAVTEAETPAELRDFLFETRAVLPEMRPALYAYRDMDAARHLFEVAAGLDSLVLGEPQILGQVTHALESARGQNAVGPVLSRLFQTAIHAGKRARTETRISRNPASVSSLAASLAAKSVADLSGAQVVILGAGEMAELAVEALRKRGAARFLVVNRTLERAQALSARWGGEATTFERLETALARADILIASTGAPHMIVHPRIAARAMQTRPARPLVMIDIAVPRDIDPQVRQIPGIRLYDIDRLNDGVEDALARRQAEIPRVRCILAEEEAAFADYLASLEILPLIAALRRQAEAIRQAEVEKTLRRLPRLEASERQRIEALSRALVKKLIDAPIRRLRLESGNGRAPEYARAARALFDLPENPAP